MLFYFMLFCVRVVLAASCQLARLAIRSNDGDSSKKRVHVVYTGSEPLSMYHADYWQNCFPELFPYSHGVFGLRRVTPMTFREWGSYLLERVELEYDVGGDGAVPIEAGTGYQPPSIARWRGDFNFIAVVSDSWKRMKLIRSASAYVRRRSFKQSLKTILDCTYEKLSEALKVLVERANMVDVFQSSHVHADVKNALTDLHHFSNQVVGSDGARQQLRHEQNGAMLLRGGIDGFLTPNVADVRNPLMVVLHGGCVKHPRGGLTAEGDSEKYVVSLLDEDGPGVLDAGLEFSFWCFWFVEHCDQVSARSLRCHRQRRCYAWCRKTQLPRRSSLLYPCNYFWNMCCV